MNQNSTPLWVTGMHRPFHQLSIKETDNFRAYRKAGDEAFAEICRILEQNSTKFKISRKIIAGSVGKRISKGYKSEPDFDVVIFVNDVRPPLEPVAQEFYRILKNSAPSRTSYWNAFHKESMEIDSYFVKLALDMNIEIEGRIQNVTISFDLQPASNLIQNNLIFGDIAKQQAEAALKEICKLEDPFSNWRMYSSSIAEATVNFTKNQPQFVHDFIRLVKLWNGNLELGQSIKIKGRSMLMELVAIKATEGAGSNMGRALRNFLQMMSLFDSINVIFHSFYPNIMDNQRVQSIIRQHSPPIVLDPTNPFDNLANGVCPQAAKKLKERAAETLEALSVGISWVGIVSNYFASD